MHLVRVSSSGTRPRLACSTDLNDNSADLKILARMSKLSGQTGRDLLPIFTEANFALIPEPSTLLLTALTLVPLISTSRGFRRRRGQTRP
jgi:hypothetical protein